LVRDPVEPDSARRMPAAADVGTEATGFDREIVAPAGGMPIKVIAMNARPISHAGLPARAVAVELRRLVIEASCDPRYRFDDHAQTGRLLIQR
jgi:hypothetical protein